MSVMKSEGTYNIFVRSANNIIQYGYSVKVGNSGNSLKSTQVGHSVKFNWSRSKGIRKNILCGPEVQKSGELVFN